MWRHDSCSSDISQLSRLSLSYWSGSLSYWSGLTPQFQYLESRYCTSYIIYTVYIYMVGGLEHFLYFHVLGMSSSQLTNSYFSEGLTPTSFFLLKLYDFVDRSGSSIGGFGLWMAWKLGEWFIVKEWWIDFDTIVMSFTNILFFLLGCRFFHVSNATDHGDVLESIASIVSVHVRNVG